MPNIKSLRDRFKKCKKELDSIEKKGQVYSYTVAVRKARKFLLVGCCSSISIARILKLEVQTVHKIKKEII